MFKFISTRLQAKLMFLMAFVCILSLSIMGYFTYRAGQKAVGTEARNSMDALVEEVLRGCDLHEELNTTRENTALALLETMFSARLGALHQVPGRFVQVEGIKVPLIVGSKGTLVGAQGVLQDFVKQSGLENADLLVFWQGKFYRVATTGQSLGAVLDSSNPAYANLLKGKSYSGMAKVGNDFQDVVYMPLFDERGQIVAAAGFAVPVLEGIKQLASDVHLGKTGYVFIVDMKGNALIHPTLAGKNILELKSDDGVEIINEMIKQKEGWLRYKWDDDKHGSRWKLTRFRYFAPRNWIVASGIYEDELYAGVDRIEREAGLLMVIFTLLALLVSLWFGTAMAKPVKELANGLETMAQGGGDLTKRLEASSKDEIGSAITAFNRFVKNIGGMLGTIKQEMAKVGSASTEMKGNAAQMAEGSSNIEAAVQQLAEGAQQQAESASAAATATSQLNASIASTTDAARKQQQLTQEAALALAQMKNTLDQTVEEVSQLASEAEKVNALAKESEELGNRTLEGTGRIQPLMETVANEISQLADKSANIGEILDTISAIADQTNLLALNAAIEAARAGQHGKGFAVVADEVRKLAELSRKSVTQIGAILGEIQHSVEATKDPVQNAVEATNEGRGLVAEFVDKTRQAARGIEEISSHTLVVSESASQVSAQSAEVLNGVEALQVTANEVAQAAEAMAHSSAEVERVISNIAAVSEESAAGTEEILASVEETNAQAAEVEQRARELAEAAAHIADLLKGFKLDDEEAGSTEPSADADTSHDLGQPDLSPAVS